MTRSILLSLFAFLLVFSVSSDAQARGTVNVGDTIPHNLALKDHTGKMRDFNDLKGEKGITLVFVRSVEWCPFCQKQVIELSKNAKEFSEAGYPVVSVSYDQLKHMEKFVTKNKPKITLLSDPRSESIRAFGILNEANAKGTMSYGIPHPGVYIVSKDKKVQAKFFKKGYKDRPTSKELLAKIKELNPPPKPVIPIDDLDNMGEDPIVPGQDVIEVPEKMTEPPVVLPEDVTTSPEAAESPSSAVESVPVENSSMPEEKSLEAVAPEVNIPAPTEFNPPAQ